MKAEFIPEPSGIRWVEHLGHEVPIPVLHLLSQERSPIVVKAERGADRIDLGFLEVGSGCEVIS